MHRRDFSRKQIAQAEVLEREKRNLIDRPQVYTQPEKKSSVNKKLPPPIPPAKRSMPARQPEPVITGYANIHRMKIGKQLGGNDSRLKLNQVVEDARRMVET